MAHKTDCENTAARFSGSLKSPQWWRQFGPGMIVASSCVGGSHIIASTQAGAYYGWHLAGLIVAVNLIKYPFFRIAFDYAGSRNRTLLQGYADCGRIYLLLFLLFNLFATVVNIAGGTVLSAALLGLLLPESVPKMVLNVAVLASFAVLFSARQYQRLDALSKWMMLLMTVLTAAAVVAVWGRFPDHEPAAGLPVLWSRESVPFLAALTGWMPAPLELAVAGSLWVKAKNRLDESYRRRRNLDFHTGYVLTVVLALLFMLLGMWTQYGKVLPPAKGGGFVALFAQMYTDAVGAWAYVPVAVLAFACIYGTTIVAVDGYSRCNCEAVALLRRQSSDAAEEGGRLLRLWMAAAVLAAGAFIVVFDGALAKMLAFAMTASFLSAPVFAWLNWRLAVKSGCGARWLCIAAACGWLVLAVFALVYLWWA